MKTKSLFSVLTALVVGSIAFAAGDTQAELKAVFDKIQTKLQAGQRTEAALAPDIAEFDRLLAAHKGEKTDDVARILVMKATLYLQVLDNEEKGLALLQQLKTDFPATTVAKQVDVMLAAMATQRSLLVGKVFPDFAERDLNGKPLSVANYKGKVVLVDFWATWCGPCVAELPNVVAAFKKFHPRGLEIIGISLDKADARQQVVDFTKEHEMSWVQYFDGLEWENKLALKYGIDGIPATFLLDREGRIIARDLRGPDLEEKLAELLAAK